MMIRSKLVTALSSSGLAVLLAASCGGPMDGDGSGGFDHKAGMTTDEGLVSALQAPNAPDLVWADNNSGVNVLGTTFTPASCDPGRKMTGGGFMNFELLTVVGSVMSPNLAAWDTSTFNPAFQAHGFGSEALCLLHPTAIVTTHTDASSTVNIPAFGTAAVTAWCPIGTLATGGGFILGTGDDHVRVYESESTSANDGWRVSGVNTLNVPVTMRAAVQCLDLPGATITRAYSSQIAMAPGAEAQAYAICPSNSIVSGNGYYSSPVTTVRLTVNDSHGSFSHAGAKNLATGGRIPIVQASASCLSIP